MVIVKHGKSLMKPINLLKKIKILFYEKCSHPECGESVSPDIYDYGMCKKHSEEAIKDFWSKAEHQKSLIQAYNEISKQL